MQPQVLDLETLGKTGQFSELLELLRATDYSDEFLCRRFNLKRAEDFEINAKRRCHFQPANQGQMS